MFFITYSVINLISNLISFNSFLNPFMALSFWFFKFLNEFFLFYMLKLYFVTCISNCNFFNQNELEKITIIGKQNWNTVKNIENQRNLIHFWLIISILFLCFFVNFRFLYALFIYLRRSFDFKCTRIYSKLN